MGNSVHRRDFVQAAASALFAGGLVGCASLVTVPVETRAGRIRLVIRNHPQLDVPGGHLRIQPAELQHHLIVLALNDGDFAVLSPVCTHQRCMVEVAGSRIVCPCHGSEYERTGRVLVGPAERPLQSYPVERTPAGELVIDLRPTA